jgi:prepilin-type N-terminal cleavage/methylation domain-containing protein
MSGNSHNPRENKARLQALADLSYGYFTAKQAIESGFIRQNHPRNVSYGNWLYIDNGLYRLPGHEDTIEANFCRWSLWSRNRNDQIQAIISCESALFYYDLLTDRPEKTHLLVPAGFRKAIPDELLVYKLNNLADIKIYDKKSFRIATPIQALHDLANTNQDNLLLDGIIREAFAKKLITEDAIAADQTLQNRMVSFSDYIYAKKPALNKSFSSVETDNPVVMTGDETGNLDIVDIIESKLKDKLELNLREAIKSEIDNFLTRTGAQDKQNGIFNSADLSVKTMQEAAVNEQSIARTNTLDNSGKLHGFSDNTITVGKLHEQSFAQMKNEAQESADIFASITGGEEISMSKVDEPETARNSRKIFHRRQAAYTLVELLMVIAIISILAAMLMPALKSSVATARQLACASNVKQLLLGVANYADENTAWVPPANAIGDRRVWVVLQDIGYFDYSSGILDCACDSTRTPGVDYYNYAWRKKNNPGLVYNLYFGQWLAWSSSWNVLPKKLTSLKHLDKDIIIADGDTTNHSNNFYFGYDEPLFWSDHGSGGLWDRHIRGHNLGFLDLHVETATYAEYLASDWKVRNGILVSSNHD